MNLWDVSKILTEEIIHILLISRFINILNLFIQFGIFNLCYIYINNF